MNVMNEGCVPPTVAKIELTGEEEGWVSGIDWLLEGSLFVDVREVYLQNKPLVVPLFQSILDREAIPPIRVRYLNDPRLAIGYAKNTSRIGAFEANGCTGDDMISDLNFLKYVWYAIHGAKLPDVVKQEFLATATDT